MKPNRILALAILAFPIVSCSVDKSDQYDTTNPNGTADNSTVNPSTNPVYDTPAAYEESGTTGTANNASTTPIAPYDPTPSATTPSSRPSTMPAVPTTPSNGAAMIHTVVAGDTLSGISSKYKVPSAAIKQANNMTTDTVVLGRKMVIPPAH